MHFVVAVDGSNESQAALDRAIEMAEPIDATLVLVHAVNPDVYELGGMEPITGLNDADEKILIQSVEEAEERGAAILEDAAEAVREAGVEVETELLYGPPADRIVEYASTREVDGIYVGHQGMSQRLEGLLGSVAKRIAERSSIPVTIVH